MLLADRSELDWIMPRIARPVTTKRRFGLSRTPAKSSLPLLPNRRGAYALWRLAEAPPDLRQDRPQPRGLHTTLCNDFCGLGRRSERRRHDIEKVNADDRDHFARRRFFLRSERPQIAVEQAESWTRTYGGPARSSGCAQQRLERSSAHRNISDAAAVAQPVPWRGRA